MGNYNPKWEQNSLFCQWLTRDPVDPNYAYCKFCSCSISATRYALTRHGNSTGHKKNEPKIDNDVNEHEDEGTLNLENCEASEQSAVVYNEIIESEAEVNTLNLDSTLVYDEEKHKVFCPKCDQYYVAKSSVIDAHVKTKKHRRNNGEEIEEFDSEVAEAEIRFAGMCVDRNVSFLFVENLLLFLKSVLVDSVLIDKISLG